MENKNNNSEFDREIFSDIENVREHSKEHLQFSLKTKIICWVAAATVGFIPGIILLFIDLTTKG